MEYNGLTLAYLGDAVFEVYMRNYALKCGLTKVKNLHQFVTSKVNGETLARYVDYLLENDYLEDDEKEIYLRGRNSKIHTVHKDLASYHKATGFEALIGYLYLLNKNERLEEIIDIVKGL